MKFLNLLMVGLVSIVISSTAFAGVKSFSKEKYTKLDNGEVYWEVSVNCTNDKKVRVIRQPVKGNDEWCSKEFPELCGRTKINTARTVCTSRYNRLLKKAESEGSQTVTETKPVNQSKPEVTPAPAVVEKVEAAPTKLQSKAEVKGDAKVEDELSIQKNQVSIEEKRLDIEQQKLELRKRELELQKQELELKQKQKLIKQ